ncbi:MAG TPA: M24 family metallopeptidase [Actinomycetota bacterium]|nr:M24 family metallopeptidase [Actinomycetota bacterium]
MTYFPMDEYEQRWSRVWDAIHSAGFETALVWGQSGGNYERCNDILYLTNYYSNQSGHAYDSSVRLASSYSAALFANGDSPELFADQPDYPEDLLAVGRVSSDRNLIRAVTAGLRQRSATGKVLSVGHDFLPVKYARLLEDAFPGIEFTYDDELVRDVRRYKSTFELECIREAGETASAALQALMETAMRGGTQADAAAAGMAELARRGGFPHMIPVSSGATIHRFTGDPIAGFSREIVMAPGDLVRAWVYGPIWQGYWLDPGRTGIVGRAGTRRQRELIRTATDITHRLMESVTPGSRVLDVVALGERLTTESGSQDDPVSNMFPLYGHGVGMFWERPTLGEGMLGEPGTEERYAYFHSGQTCTIEVFLSWPGVGSAGIEECFIVQDGKNELLTTTDLEWW